MKEARANLLRLLLGGALLFKNRFNYSDHCLWGVQLKRIVQNVPCLYLLIVQQVLFNKLIQIKMRDKDAYLQLKIIKESLREHWRWREILLNSGKGHRAQKRITTSMVFMCQNYLERMDQILEEDILITWEDINKGKKEILLLVRKKLFNLFWECQQALSRKL